LRSVADIAAAVEAPSRVLSFAEQVTTEPVVAPQGRLERHLLDLGVRDKEMLRQGVELDQRAQQLLSRASGQIGPPDVVAAPEPEPTAADAVPEVVQAAEAAVDEPEIDVGLEIGPD
jgi:hypothetical protein